MATKWQYEYVKCMDYNLLSILNQYGDNEYELISAFIINTNADGDALYDLIFKKIKLV